MRRQGPAIRDAHVPSRRRNRTYPASGRLYRPASARRPDSPTWKRVLTMTAPLSVLFADHDLAATRLLRMELRKRGARVDFADSAGEVVHRASSTPPDLLILDESLQTQEDRDLVELYHASAPETEIILTHDGEGSISHGLGMGLLLTARKPLS